jgi:putative ABC transport system substrate-binding protein
VIRQAPRVWDPFFDELSASGFVEGKTLEVIARLGGGGEHYDAIATELVNAGVDAMVTAGVPATSAAQRATQRIPILTISDDLVGEHFVALLAHPGANITGISIIAFELDRKRQEILLELVPATRHLAALVDPQTTPPQQLREIEEAAHARNIDLAIHRATTRDEIVAAIAAAKAAGAEAINVLRVREF